jgi:hypothetical protein
VSLAWTTDELLADIREQGRIADDDPEATDAILLTEATHQMHRVFVPMIRKARSEYYETTVDLALVANQAYYDLPKRSVSSSVRNVALVNAAGLEMVLSVKPAADRHGFVRINSNVPAYYTLLDDQICLMPTPLSAIGYTVRVTFEYRPGSLVAASAANKISSVAYNATTGQYTLGLAAAPVVSAAYVDVQRASSPFSVSQVESTLVSTGTGPNQAVVTPAVNIFTAANSLALRPQIYHRAPRIGDWLCNSDETVIPQIPPEFHPLLALAVASKWLRPIDPEMSATMFQELQGSIKDQLSLLSPRNVGASMKIKSQSSMLRRNGRRIGGRTFADWK